MSTRGVQVTDCRRNPVNEKTRQTCIYCQNMLRYGISGHLQAFANVLKRHIKSVSPKKKEIQKVGAVGFDSIRNVYFFFTKVAVSNEKRHIFLQLSYVSHEIQILRSYMGVSIPHLNF